MLRWHKFAKYFTTLSGVKIITMHHIVPVNLRQSISIAGMSECLSDCAILVKPIFRNITALANSTIATEMDNSAVTANHSGTNKYIFKM